MEPIICLFYGINGVILGIGLFSYGLVLLKRKHLLENTPFSKIRSIAMGPVALHGEVRADRLIKSPFQKKDCVYYRYIIDNYRYQGKNWHYYAMKAGSEGVPFYIKDKTGSVLVNPKDAKISISKKFESSSQLGGDVPKAILSFLKKNESKFGVFHGTKRPMQFIEFLIQPKQKLYIFGTAGDNPYVKEGTAKQNEEDIMIQKGKNLFYISDKPEKEILPSMQWKMIGGLIGGAALTVIGIVFLFNLFGIM